MITLFLSIFVRNALIGWQENFIHLVNKIQRSVTMKKVVVQYDDKVQFFENVTKIQLFCVEDYFNDHLDIFQGSKKTVLKLY